jgi:hypothetical protein
MRRTTGGTDLSGWAEFFGPLANHESLCDQSEYEVARSAPAGGAMRPYNFPTFGLLLCFVLFVRFVVRSSL